MNSRSAGFGPKTVFGSTTSPQDGSGWKKSWLRGRGSRRHQLLTDSRSWGAKDRFIASISEYVSYIPLPLSFTISVQYGADVWGESKKKTLPWWCQEVRIITHTNNSRGFIFISLHLSASRTGKRLSRAVSLGSLNQDLMGIALSAEAELERRALARHVHQSGLPGYALYAPGELSKMKTEERSAQMADRSLV